MKNQDSSNPPRCLFCNEPKELVSESLDASGVLFEPYICESCQAAHAVTFDVTLSRIRQMEAKALKRLRELTLLVDSDSATTRALGEFLVALAHRADERK
jgi:hypothetical protein